MASVSSCPVADSDRVAGRTPALWISPSNPIGSTAQAVDTLSNRLGVRHIAAQDDQICPGEVGANVFSGLVSTVEVSDEHKHAGAQFGAPGGGSPSETGIRPGDHHEAIGQCSGRGIVGLPPALPHRIAETRVPENDAAIHDRIEDVGRPAQRTPPIDRPVFR